MLLSNHSNRDVGLVTFVVSACFLANVQKPEVMLLQEVIYLQLEHHVIEREVMTTNRATC